MKTRKWCTRLGGTFPTYPQARSILRLVETFQRREGGAQKIDSKASFNRYRKGYFLRLAS
jgi:hypothetical protein